MKRPPVSALLLGLILIAANTLPAQDDAKKDEPIAPFRDEATGLEFGDIEGFERLKEKHFDTPGLGYAVDYRSKSKIRFSVYVYDLGIEDIPDGPFSDAVKKTFNNSKADIVAAKEKGHYQKADELTNEIILLGESDAAPKLRRATYRLRRSDKDWISYVYLTGYKKKFVKLRLTLPADKHVECEKEAAKLLERIGSMLTDASSA